MTKSLKSIWDNQFINSFHTLLNIIFNLFDTLQIKHFVVSETVLMKRRHSIHFVNATAMDWVWGCINPSQQIKPLFS